MRLTHPTIPTAATSHRSEAIARTAPATVVMVTFHSRWTVGPSLDAIETSHRKGLVECVVIDNASTDGTADYIARAYPWVTLIRSRENLGFGRGCNLSFQHVTTPYLILLNPDAVLDCDATETLIQFLDRTPAAGIAAPATLDDEGQPHCAGTMVTPAALLRSVLGRHVHAYPERRHIHPGDAPFRTSWVCGAAMIVRSELFRTLSGFDERFFLYFEETDLCRRAAKLGAEIWAVGEAVAHHSGSASAKATGDELHSSCIATHYRKSRRQYLLKHFGVGRGLGTEVLLRCIDRLYRIRKRLFA